MTSERHTNRMREFFDSVDWDGVSVWAIEDDIHMSKKAHKWRHSYM